MSKIVANCDYVSMLFARHYFIELMKRRTIPIVPVDNKDDIIKIKLDMNKVLEVPMNDYFESIEVCQDEEDNYILEPSVKLIDNKSGITFDMFARILEFGTRYQVAYPHWKPFITHYFPKLLDVQYADKVC